MNNILRFAVSATVMTLALAACGKKDETKTA
jgi:uncharacterized lipoprotein YehR (DUF1307 family)